MINVEMAYGLQLHVSVSLISYCLDLSTRFDCFDLYLKFFFLFMDFNFYIFQHFLLLCDRSKLFLKLYYVNWPTI